MNNLFQENSDDISEEDKIIFNNGEVLFSQGDPSNYLYLIKKGKVLIAKEEKGTLRKIEVLAKKEIVGLNSLISDVGHEYTAFAIGRVEVVKIKKSEIKGILKKCEPWIMDLMRVICGRLNKTVEVLESHHLLEKLNFQDDELGDLSSEDLYMNLNEYRERKNIRANSSY